MKLKDSLVIRLNIHRYTDDELLTLKSFVDKELETRKKRKIKLQKKIKSVV